MGVPKGDDRNLNPISEKGNGVLLFLNSELSERDWRRKNMERIIMKIFKGISVFLLLFLISINSILAQDTKASDSKLDPMLRILSQKIISVDAAKNIMPLQEIADQEPRVKTIVRFKENLNGVEALSGKIGSIIGDIATVEIPLSSLEALSQLENIIYVEASKKVEPKLNISVPETRATLLRGGTPPVWTGITGKNVIVGIVDSGIDFTRPDFKDATGKTRILYLWDQTTGQECTNMTIDDGTCNQIDTDGHGTHVAGIAAGNGSASNYKKYVGMAPEADLIVYKTNFYTDDILNGISYIQQKAASLSKPSVTNLSLGQHVDPHDGTSHFSMGIDNASGPGKIIVGAAGNEAGKGIHTSGYVSQGSQTPRAFQIPSGKSNVKIDIWYSGSDSMQVAVTTPLLDYTGLGETW